MSKVQPDQKVKVERHEKGSDKRSDGDKGAGSYIVRHSPGLSDWALGDVVASTTTADLLVAFRHW